MLAVKVTFVPSQIAPAGAATILIVGTKTGFTVMANICGAEEPQALFAVTVIFPLVELAVVIIEFVVDVPVHPPGKAQV